MVGPEQQIIEQYVAAGQVQIIYWPITDLGVNSINAAATAYCAGEQDPALFWDVYYTLFQNYGQTYRGDRAYFLETAVAAGADEAQFAACFDSGEKQGLVQALDQERRDNGIRQRPTFEINGQQLFGAVPFSTFEGAIEDVLP